MVSISEEGLPQQSPSLKRSCFTGLYLEEGQLRFLYVQRSLKIGHFGQAYKDSQEDILIIWKRGKGAD